MSTSKDFTLHTLQDSLQEKRDEWSRVTKEAAEKLSRSAGPCITEIHSLVNLVIKLQYLDSEYSKLAGVYCERTRIIDKLSGVINE